MGHLTLHVITEEFSVCKLKDYSSIDISHPFVFTGATDEENISAILAGNGIGIFAISTFNTDYILVKEENFEKALNALGSSGYEICG